MAKRISTATVVALFLAAPPGMTRSGPDGLAAALAAAAAAPGSWTEMRLLVECTDESAQRSVEVLAGGVAIWNGQRQFDLSDAEMGQLLQDLIDGGFTELAPSYGGGPLRDPGQPGADAESANAAVIVCQIDLTLDALQWRSEQLARGEQSPALRSLAERLLDRLEERGTVGVGIGSLSEGLDKILVGDLAPETLTLQFQQRPASAVPGTAAEGLLLTLRGRATHSRRWSAGAGFSDVAARTLTEVELHELLEVLIALAPESASENFWSEQYTDLTISVLDHRSTMQAQRFAGLEPMTHGDRQRAFNRALGALVAVHRRTLRENAPDS